MQTIDLNTLTIAKARKALDSKEFSAVDLATAYLEQIKNKNGEINAYLEIYDDVLEQAKIADEKIAKGDSSPLLGIPLSIKDNILISGRTATSASKILTGYVALYDATVIKKLKESGAVFLGRTNMDELAMGGSTENSAYGVTKNPLDLTRVPGGTSGGASASVAMNGTLAGIGSDTGGSVRNPASFCSVVGLKPTYGLVSRYGLVSYANSIEQIGPIARKVEDVALLLNHITGKDPNDNTTVDNQTQDYLTGIDSGIPAGVYRRFPSSSAPPPAGPAER